ncbi:hypothetical protein GCM10027161_39360 [Microbispora hainanensis]
MTQDPLEKEVGSGGEAHRGAGVTRARFLHGVHRQGSHDVDRLPVKITPLKACAAQLLDPLLFSRRFWHFPPTGDPNGFLVIPFGSHLGNGTRGFGPGSGTTCGGDYSD